ncbi:MAG: tetratricopeptide repeat protein [Methylococcales bacterium]|nr:tetratricopeptide repeat protein [Methylococcales bacterium]
MNRQQRRATEKKLRKGQAFDLGEVLSSTVKLHQEGHLAEAEANYRAILQAIPKQPDACHYLGLLLHQRGQSAEGVALIKCAIEMSPGYVDAYNNLGNVYKETGELAKAADCYQKVIGLVPGHGPALNNLGVVRQNQGDYSQAILVLLEATALSPNNHDFFQNLGNAYRKQGDFKQAAVAFRRSIALQPYQADAYKNLWRTHYLAREFDDAAEVLRQWLVCDPDNPVARHTLAAQTGEGNIPERASNGYVQQTFDNFAGSFDQVLERLDYRAPEWVASAVANVYPQAAANLVVLDAGCGTGLCGPLLKPYATRLVGVDLSSKMLAKAIGRQVYDELLEAELVAYLAGLTGVYDLIVSADTLVYFGELRPFFKAANDALSAAGHLVFTLEKGDNSQDYKLNIHGRYSHAQAYVEAAITGAGLRICAIGEVTLRKEAGEPVLGWLVTAARCTTVC